VTPTVVEVGPQTLRGPGVAPRLWVSTAFEFIDDPMALLDEQPVEMSMLWRDVLAAVAGAHADPLVLVVPSWWSSRRIAVVGAAAALISSDVVVVHRCTLLADGADATVVELSADYAVVSTDAPEPLIFSRGDAAFTAHLETVNAVLLDVPVGVPPLAAATSATLRRLGIPILRSTDDRLRRAAAAAARSTARNRRRARRIRPGRGTTAVLAGTALTVAAAGAGWAAQAHRAQPTDAATRLLVDGGIAVRVPAPWAVEHITSGSGSARVRVAAPGGTPALHITQSTYPTAGGIAAVAETLRRAIEAETDGVFVEFDPAAHRGGRPAVTYTERRAAGDTRWAVVVDGATRIAIGCQGAPGDQHTIESVCLEAVRSAHVVH
jgi:type VII secretion-associated protein (TIGR03931 family)